MNSKELQPLYGIVRDLLELKLEVLKNVDNFSRELLRVEQKLQNEEENGLIWSYIFSELRQAVDDVDVEYIFNFVDDIEEALNDVDYKEKMAIRKIRSSINPIFRNTPVYFDINNFNNTEQLFQNIDEKE
jgi:hypothetical protein